jgi:transposase
MAGPGGSPGSYCRRDIVNAIRYLTHNGPVWRALPADLPNWRTVYGYARDWPAAPPGGCTMSCASRPGCRPAAARPRPPRSSIPSRSRPPTPPAGHLGSRHRTLQIVKRPDDLHTLQVPPRRRVVKRTFGWIMKHRRCVRDDERLPAHHQTYLYQAMIRIMAARIARRQPPAPSAPVPAPARPQAAPPPSLLQAA